MKDEATIPLFTSDVARLLRMSEGAVRLLERTGKLPAVRTPRGVRLFDPGVVAQFVRDREARRAAGRWRDR